MTQFIRDLFNKFKDNITQRNVLYALLFLGVGQAVMSQIVKYRQNLRFSYYDKIVEAYIEQRRKQTSAFLEQYDNNTISAENQEQILNSDLKDLVELLQNKTFSSEQLTITYLLRIAQVGIPSNFIADIDYELALNQARQKDLQRKEAEQKKLQLPELHGVPITIKDHICVKGLKSTMGLVNRLSLPNTTESSIVAALRNAGCVFLCMTNIPQFCASFVTENFIFGLAKNPWNDQYSVGGSSGGSAGAVATKCCPISIGSDLLGSIRIPAAWNGLYSLKPTNYYISKRGVMAFSSKCDVNIGKNFQVSLGPIGRCVDDLVIIMRNLIGKFDTDPLRNVNQEFNTYQFQQFGKGKLRIGFMTKGPSYMQMAPMNENVLKEVADQLKQLGHQIVEFNFDEFWHINTLVTKMLIGSGMNKMLIQETKGERTKHFVKNVALLEQIPGIVKMLISRSLNKDGLTHVAQMFSINKHNAEELKDIEAQSDRAVYQFFDTWNEKKIDALITPLDIAFALTVSENQQYAAPGIMGITNLMQLPAGTVPIRLVRHDEQQYMENSLNTNKKENFLIKEVRTTCQYAAGMPVCVQVCTLPNKDEKCLKLMKIIEDIFKFHRLANVV